MKSHHPFDKLRQSMSRPSQKRVQKKVVQLRQEMALAEAGQPHENKNFFHIIMTFPPHRSS
jgi:hypothetical protein